MASIKGITPFNGEGEMGLKKEFDRILIHYDAQIATKDLLVAICAEEGHKDSYGHDGEKINETCERCGRDKWDRSIKC